MFAAIALAEAAPAIRVTVLEAGAECLSKVRISGGGRCNVTHDCLDPKHLVTHYPRGAEALLGPFHRFGPQDTIDWFTWRGVELKVEADGRMFPVSDQSASIIDALLQAARDASVEIRTRCPVRALSRDATGWQLRLRNDETIPADRVILATGSSRPGHQLAERLGHQIVAPVPSLFTFNIPEPWLTGLAGTSVANARVRLLGLSETIETAGPLLCTHWGLSGPAVLRASAWGARLLQAVGYRCEIRVDWLGTDNAEAVIADLRAQHGGKAVMSTPPPGLTKRLWQALVAASGSNDDQRWSELSRGAQAALVAYLGDCRFEMQGKSTFKEEFVTAGGIDRDEVDWRTFESRVVPGLHVVGECLDVDAITGGFNFQNAWTSGYLAGTAIAVACSG